MDSTIRGAPLAEERLGALTLGGFLEEVCRRNGDKEALVFHPPAGAVVRCSYAEIWREACLVARALIARGVTKETRVGLLATNRPEWITAMFGITLSGATCVLLSTFAKGPELEHQLRLGDVSLLIFERRVLGRDFACELAAICPGLAHERGEVRSTRLPFLRGAVCIGEPAGGAFGQWGSFLRDDLAPAALIEAVAAEIAPTDRGLVFFSSGTTARPKVIVHAHRAAAIQCWRWARILALDPQVRTWSANGFFWSGNFAMAMGSTLAAGGCIVLQSHFDAAEALRLMHAERVSHPVAWPHQWAKLVADPAWRETDLSSFKYVGERLPVHDHPTIKSDWDEPFAAYGSTETFTLVTVHPSGTARAISAGNNGVPLPGNTIRITDPLSGRVLGRNQAGEIAAKGPTLMLGYLRIAPEDTFDAEGFFLTGDGGFVDDQGQLHWQGRMNDIIKTGGANVSPPEVDSVLVDCPGVKIGATVGVPHDTLGEMVVACVVPEADASIDESSVRAFLSKRLSSYKVPRRVLFFQESEVTLTGSNKVKLGPLRELAARRLADG